MSKELTALKELKNQGSYYTKDGIDISTFVQLGLDIIESALEALEIIKECLELKIIVDGDTGCLYVPITKCFQPLEQNIVIVGYIKGKDKIDLLKEILC